MKLSSGVCSLALALITTLTINSHSQTATEKALAFDAASIKLNDPAVYLRGVGPNGSLRFTAAGVVGRNVTARRIILAAYHLTPFQVSGGPAWLDSIRFDLDAKSASAADREQLGQMLQTMLAERFKLVVHWGTKEMPVFEMTVGKKGFKLLEWKDGAPMPQIPGVPAGGGGRAGGGASGGGALFDHLSMQAFADLMTNNPEVGRPVLDKTGIQGLYLISIHWDDDQNFVSAAEEATGLKLESQKAALKFLTIDSAEKPSEN